MLKHIITDFEHFGFSIISSYRYFSILASYFYKIINENSYNLTKKKHLFTHLHIFWAIFIQA